MQTPRPSTFWRVSLVKALACLCIGWTATAAADDPPPQLTTAQLEDLLLPPLGWKVDKEVLRTHFWRIHTPIFADEEESSLTVFPFWPAFFQLEVKDGHIKERTPQWFRGTLGGLLQNGLNSTDPVIKKKSQLWLRESLILYFAGFRLSRIEGQRPYAPWIKAEDGRRLDRLADEYIAGQKVIRAGDIHPHEVSDRLLAEWMEHPPTSTLPDIVGYYDVLEANHDWMSVEYIYPVSWTWLRGTGNKKMVARTGIDEDSYGFHTHRLVPSTHPPTTAPFSLWLRDAYLSYIAGKELFESKHLPMADKHNAMLLKDALRQWWAGVEKEK